MIFNIKNILIIVFLISTVILSYNKLYAKNILIKDIQIIGNEKVSKNEILNGAVLKNNDGILINMDRLKNNMKKQKIIKNYEIQINKNVLKIVIKEKLLFINLIIKKVNNKNIIIPIYEDLQIAGINKIYSDNLPVLLIDEKDIINNKISERIKKILKIFITIWQNDRRFFNYITKVDSTSNISKIYFNKAQTIYLWDEKMKSLRNLILLYKIKNFNIKYANGICENKMIALW